MSGEFQRAVSLVKGYVNREWDRINALERLDAHRELEGPYSGPTQNRRVEREEIIRDAAHARRILDVSETATYDEIKTAYEKLSELSRPEQFANGTEEQARATRIQRSIHTAYRILIEEFSTTERRFKSLEID